MSGVKGKSGGKREGSGRPTLNNPTTWRDYEVIKLPRPKDEREEAALEWFKELEPFQRMAAIVKLYYS